MTALVPTTGHRDLITFAANFPDNNVEVMVNARSQEPIPGEVRALALDEAFENSPNVTVTLQVNDEAPQEPEDHPDFWNWWRTEISDTYPGVTWDYVVASEPYGLKLGETLGAMFMPFDIPRELNAARGTTVREDPVGNWDRIIPEFRKHMTVNAVFFGQESVGKTTISKLVSEQLYGVWCPEWARPFLEVVEQDVTPDCMNNIHRGQYALQKLVKDKAEAPYLLFDTDLYSTLGYWGIMGKTPPLELAEDAREFMADVYYLLPDDVPFEVDPLRYGGDKRESEIGFWAELIDREGLTVINVPTGTLESKVEFIVQDLTVRFTKVWGMTQGFKRTN
jgi:NadR type nicotinamide-nucleotide adenylyltransferase